MFVRAAPLVRPLVTIFFEGQPLAAEEGMTVAAAVLGHSHDPSHGWTRATHTGQKRGPYCHMGVCCECLMTIDGVPNQQACLVLVAEGMRVSRQNGAPGFGPDETPQGCKAGDGHA